ncbi:glycosyltransferase family 2 protein [Serratia proteamaculans]
MSDSSPLLSIIIPFFNNEDFIIPCLESLFHQIDDDIEVVIIDDGSTDNSANLVQHFLAKISHSNVKLISQNNGGIGFTRNVGLDNSRGEYITFLDGDDLLSRNYMKVLRPHLASGEFDLIDFNYERFTLQPSESSVCENVPCVQYNFEQQGLNCMETLFTKSMWHLWNRIYRRSLFDNERFEIGRRYEDVILTPFLYFKTQKIARIDQILYFYRDNHHGITRNIKEKDIEDMLFAMKKMISVAQRQPENTALRGLAARMIANCFSEVKSMSKAVYGYYFYKKETVKVFREAALLCTGTAVPGKKIGQMRYPQIDTLFSRARLRIKKR